MQRDRLASVDVTVPATPTSQSSSPRTSRMPTTRSRACSTRHSRPRSPATRITWRSRPSSRRRCFGGARTDGRRLRIGAKELPGRWADAADLPRVRVVAFNALGRTTAAPVLFTTTGTGAAGPPGAPGAPGAPGKPGAPGAPADNGGGSGLNNVILNLLSRDKRAMMRIDAGPEEVVRAQALVRCAAAGPPPGGPAVV